MFKTNPKEIYEDLVTKGVYEEAHLDKDEVKKVLAMAIEDYQFAKSIKKLDKTSWRVIFNAYYDVLRELCDQLMRFKNQKISNHQGLFAFITLNFKELELDWDFFESIRTIRNKNKYQGLDVSENMWKSVELQFDLYISTLYKSLETRLID